MGNKNPASRVVNIPSQFMPLVEKEMEETGCFTVCETMGRILANHFGRRPPKPATTQKEAAIKGVKIGDG